MTAPSRTPPGAPVGPDHLVVFQPSGRQGRVAAGTTLLEAARRLGADVDSVCGGRQTCGKCKVVVEAGVFAKYAIESAADHLAPADGAEREYFARRGGLLPGARLACAAVVTGDVLVTVPLESRARKQIVRKAADQRTIEVDPVVRRVFVDVEPHRLGARKGDWERLQDALAREWGLEGLAIDLPALRRLGAALREGKQRVTATVWHGREVIDVAPGYHEGVYGLAVDVGSTTLAAHLCDLRTGALLATESAMNPQVTYGDDLMSRVSYAMSHEDGLRTMHEAIVRALNDLAAAAARAAGLSADELYEMVVVGNTVMHHILLGLDPSDLGAAPFTLATHAPLDVKARELGLRLHPGASVHFAPLEAGHVGSDNVGVLVAEAIDRQDELVLALDVGTNAEVLLGNRERVQSCSSPTGPAFEGAQIRHGQRAAPGAIERVRIDRATGEPRFRVLGRDGWSDEPPPGAIGATGLCGTGIVEVVAELFLAGLLRADGRFDADRPCPRLRWQGAKAEYVLATADQTATGGEIVVTQDDVRSIQLAKAALYAGAKLLMRRRGVTSVDRIVLAGAFGSYIDPLRAMVLGLYPDCPLERVRVAGNAAGDGARILLLSKARRLEAAAAARRVEYVETAVDPHFQAEFVAAMHLPHRSDPFPHLAALGVLPPPPATPRPRRAEQRRRGAP